MDNSKIQALIEGAWEQSIIPELVDYIRIPNKSPLYDPQWRENGHMHKAVSLIERWCRSQAIEGMKLEVIELEKRTPLIFIDIPGNSDDCVLLYGHLDKQPEMIGWREDLGPWTPVIENEKLYGRGGADDGYAAFAALTAVATLQKLNVPHARCVVLIESCEESGSYDLPFYIEALEKRIGIPSLIICLDSGCGNYDQLWCTTSLRGLVAGDLSVRLLREGVHSGDGSGVAASSFRVMRRLLSRLEDEETGMILIGDFHVTTPQHNKDQAADAARILGKEVYSKFPFLPGVRPMSDDPAELILNRTWRPALSITGAEGFPALKDAGNVLRPFTSIRLSLRVPPGCNAEQASIKLKELLEADPPYGAHVKFELGQYAEGWSAPKLSEWLENSINAASKTFFGEPVAYMGEGGSIPFMDMLGKKYPKAQFFITGVLGPNSNAHGPNEFLHIPTGWKVTCCVARVLADHFGK